MRPIKMQMTPTISVVRPILRGFYVICGPVDIYNALSVEFIKTFAKHFSTLFERSPTLQKLLKDFSRE